MSEEQRTFDPAIVRAVTFDGFGTVFDFPTARFKEAFARVGAGLTPAVEGDALWERWLEVGKNKWGQGSPEDGSQVPRTRPFRLYRDVWPEQFAETFAAVGAAGDAAWAMAFLFAEIERAGVYPEAPAVLAALRRRYPIALVSNADEAFLGPPFRAGALPFDAVITSEAARAYKPEPAMFERAARELGVPASAILHVGDSPRADVAGAITAGLQVAWIQRHGEELPEGVPEPHLRIATLDPLLAALGLRPPD